MASNGTGERLSPGKHELIDREVVVDFEFEGKLITAHQGDTVGSALTAVGIDLLSRSFKYHRRRGLLCVAGQFVRLAGNLVRCGTHDRSPCWR